MREIIEKILPQERVDEFFAIGQHKTIKKGEYYIRGGDIPRKFAFVISGLFRYVYINDKGQEFTKGIIPELKYISSYSAMITNTPSYFFIEALEDSEIYTIAYEKWQDLVETDIFWVKYLLELIERGFMIKEKRERDLLLINAETRYLEFLEEFPGIEKRINQTIIASYLGIRPESLSRIRKNPHT